MLIYQSTHIQPSNRVLISLAATNSPPSLRALWPVAPAGSVTDPGISVSISRPTATRLGQTVVEKEKGDQTAFYTQVHICTIQLYPALTLYVFYF